MPDNGGKPKIRVELTEWDMSERHELGALKDLEVKPEAMRMFYDACTKMVLLSDPNKVWAIYEEAADDLSYLYAQSKDAKVDFGLLDFLLKRRAWSRMKDLGADIKQGKALPIVFTPMEKLELESLQDIQMIPMAKELFAGLVVEMQKARVDQLMDIFHEGQRIFAQIYESSEHLENDLSKWMMMLTLRLRKIALQKR